MAKIVVYEDSLDDAISRYKELTRSHDVYLFFDDWGQISGYSRDEHFVFSDLEKAGFKRDHVYKEIPEMPVEADIYFVDGLCGSCFQYLEALPKEKTFLASGDPELSEMATDEGYRAIRPESIDEVLKGILGSK